MSIVYCTSVDMSSFGVHYVLCVSQWPLCIVHQLDVSDVSSFGVHYMLCLSHIMCLTCLALVCMCCASNGLMNQALLF